MQTILGSTGIIGKGLAKEISQFTDDIRLVSRNPKKVNQKDEVIKADLSQKEQVMNAVSGSDIVYLTVGLKYDSEVWNKLWESILRNVIESCKYYNSKLVFFDNVYAYGKVAGWMNEDTPLNPISKKGNVRKKLQDILMKEILEGNIKAMIVKSADFYGTDASSIINFLVLDNLSKGKKPKWLVNADKKHSFTYTKDAIFATALLGNTESAYNQVWHLPTDRNALTGREIISLAVKEFNIKDNFTLLPKWILEIAGLFNKFIKENNEMIYQLEYDYLFDSSKFEETFNISPTKYRDGILETINSMKKII